MNTWVIIALIVVGAWVTVSVLALAVWVWVFRAVRGPVKPQRYKRWHV